MTGNPYQPPSAMVDVSAPSPVTRAGLTAIIESFLAGESTAFEFDEQLDDYCDADDPLIRYVASTMWHFYDDCDDHRVCLSKPAWDFIQRLLLLLASDCHLETTVRHKWSVRQLIAAFSLCLFGIGALLIGWSYQLFLLAIPFGVISMMLDWFPPRGDQVGDPWEPLICPFATMTDLEKAYRAASFRKTRYPPHLAGHTIRSAFMERFYLVHSHLVGLLMSPLLLLWQTLPERETVTTARAT